MNTARDFVLTLVVCVSIGLLPACGEKASDPPFAAVFEDVAETVGLSFKVESGATGEHYLVETMLGGVGWIDYDGDGDYDLYLPNGHGDPRRAASPGDARNALYRNDGAKGFVDVTEAAAVGDARYSHGVAVADYDNDGDSDLLVTNFGRNTLYRSRGDGTFEDVTDEVRLGGSGYHMSAAWFDLDRDGDLDLYITRYLEYRPDTARPCYHVKRRGYCHPALFAGQPDLLYRNDGADGFEEIGHRAGIDRAGDLDGKGLGVIASDFDRDGWVDLYVANDTTANFLWRNNGDGTFTDVAPEWGVALGNLGEPQAGMGIDWGDVNGDGRMDVHVTNFSEEANNLFLALGSGNFVDGALGAGLGRSRKLLGFGTVLVDIERDGDLDIVVANGHVNDHVETISEGTGITYRQAPSLYLNDGEGRFEPVGARAGGVFAAPMVGRGLAAADYDNDGDVDLALVALDCRVALLRNSGAGASGYLRVRLVGTTSPRDAYGARIEARVQGRVRQFEYQSARSYLSACDPRVVIGLGSVDRVEELKIFWPSGHVQRLENVSGNREIIVTEE